MVTHLFDLHRRARFLGCLVVFFTIVSCAYSGVVKVGRFAGEFLDLGAGARSLAMGGAGRLFRDPAVAPPAPRQQPMGGLNARF